MSECVVHPNGQPEAEPAEVNADGADDPAGEIVIIGPEDFRLPEVFRHIKAGKRVLVIPQHNGPEAA